MVNHPNRNKTREADAKRYPGRERLWVRFASMLDVPRDAAAMWKIVENAAPGVEVLLAEPGTGFSMVLATPEQADALRTHFSTENVRPYWS